MTPKKYLKFFATILLIAATTGLHAADCENPSRLRFSLIPQADTKKNASDFALLLKELEAKLGKPVEVVLPTSYGSVVEGLLAKSIDIAMLGPASYATAKNSDPDIVAFATYISRAGAFQEASQFQTSLLIVQNNSRFQSIETLKEGKIALVDPKSTTGAVLPRFYFSRMISQPFDQFFSRVVYSGGHDKSALAVLEGRIDAAFVSSYMLSDFINKGKAKKEDFRVLWRSEQFPDDPFVYRGHLCPRIKETIRKVFLESDGKQFPVTLDSLNAVRFIPANDDNYKTIREILRTMP